MKAFLNWGKMKKYIGTGVSEALTCFFKCLTHGLMTNTRHNLQFHQLVRQQPQSPLISPFRRIAAKQGNQMSFNITIYNAFAGRMILLLAFQSRL